MRLYLEVARRAFRRATIYRSAYIAGALTTACFGALRSFVFIALFQAGSTVAGYSLHDALSYTWATQALISIGAGWLVANDLLIAIRTGNVITDMMRPWNFFGYWFSLSLGERLCNLLTRGLLTYGLGMLYFGVYVPGPAQLLAFAATVSLALVVSFALSFLVSLTAFWLIDNTGLVMIFNMLISFFSGFLVPIDFFPSWLAAVARVLPFRAITQLPAEALLDRLQGTGLVEALLIQGLWAVTLTGMSLLVLQAATRKVVVQGG